MDELTKYIFYSYFDLLTQKEKTAHRASFAEEKAENLEPSKLQEFLRERWGSEDPEIRHLLAGGPDEFMRNVRDRIMRENADKVFLNHCPKCGALTKTPQAKQCPKCFFSWHDAV